MKLKLLILFLTLSLIFVIITHMMKAIPEGLCGNYSLTYSKVKDIFRNSDISGISQAYNMHYKRDLLLNC